MKIKVKVPKRLINPPIDFCEAVYGHGTCGVKLSYNEYDFIVLSGKIVLFDAYSTAHGYKPFDLDCGKIAFPFYLGCPTDKGERVAYCGLRLSEERAVRFEPLITSGTDFCSISEDTIGIPIPSGVCCLGDEEGYAKYRAHVRDEIPPLAGIIVLDGQTHTLVSLYDKKYAVFSSGWGDGRYRVYAGYAESGKAACILVDFAMIDYPPPDEGTVEVEVDAPDGFVFDPTKSEAENMILRRSAAINSPDVVERLKAYSRRGYEYHARNDTEHALADYLAAIECSKQVEDGRAKRLTWSVYDNAAEIYCAQGDYNSAIKLMLDALAANDNFYTGAYVRLIDMYQLTKRSDEALEIAKRMVSARPDDPVAHSKYAECCVACMDFLSAAAAYATLADEFKLYESLFDEAACLIEAGDTAAAEQALESHPAKEKYEQYWYYKAFIEYKKHNFRTALSFATLSHETDGEYMPALYLLIDIYSLLNDYRAVAVCAEKYKKLRPDLEYGYSVCADAQLILGNIAESARGYVYLMEHVKNDDKYAALAAILCFKIGDTKRSSAIIKRLRNKKSEYYNGVQYATHVTARSKKRSAIDNRNAAHKYLTTYKTDCDDDFLLSISIFLLQTGNVIQATQLLENFFDGNLSYEVVAQQIRAAEKIGDKKHFLSFLDFYVKNFIDVNATPRDVAEIANSFIPSEARRAAWLSELLQ